MPAHPPPAARAGQYEPLGSRSTARRRSAPQLPTARPTAAGTPVPTVRRMHNSSLSRGRSIDHWEPDEPAFWAPEGSRIARKNLIFSIFAEHIGFSIWVLWTIVVLDVDA